MSPLKVTQIRSVIGSKQGHKRTVRALGLKRIRDSRVHEDTPQIRGMVHKVQHLVACRGGGLAVRLNEINRRPGLQEGAQARRARHGLGTRQDLGTRPQGRGRPLGRLRVRGYEGGQMPLQRRLPRLKGEARGRHTVARPTVYAPVNLGELQDLPGDTIGPDELRAAGLVRKKAELVKILGEGTWGAPLR